MTRTEPTTGWWPIALGVGSAAGVAFIGDAPAVILVCAAIYLLAAVTGRAGSAWLGFAASIPMIGAGYLLDSPWVALALVGLACAVLIVLGTIRGTWHAPHAPRQLIAVFVFAAVAVAAAVVHQPVLATLVAAGGLVAHGAWDVRHHRRDIVVSRQYSAFCAVLDFVLAGVLLVSLVVNHSAR